MSEIFTEIAMATNLISDFNSLLDWIMKKVVEVMKVEAASLMLVDEENQDLEVKVVLGPRAEKLKNVRFSFEEGICGWVAKTGKPVIATPAEKDTRFNPKVDTFTGFRTDSIFCVPIEFKNKTIGVIEVMNKKDGQPFAKADLELLTGISGQVAVLLENARLWQEVSLSKRFLEQVLEIIPVGFIAVDRFGQIILLNSQAAKLLSLEKKNVEGKSFQGVLPKDMCLIIRQGMLTGEEKKKERLQLEIKERKIELTCSTLLVKDKENIFTCGIIFSE